MSAVLDRMAYDYFEAWAASQPEWSELAQALRQYDLRQDFETIVRAMLVPRPPTVTVEGPLGPAPSGTSYDSWSEPKRRAANLDALRVLRRLQAEQQIASPTDLAYLRAYTGWGGIDVRQLPDDPILFPPEYVEGIREWRTAADRGQIPSSGVFAGLRHQFFTPMPVAEAMWGLARRVAPFALTTALEPSVGIGRFLQATPSDVGVLWTGVEMDPLLVQLTQAAYPTAEIVGATFEQFFLGAVAEGRAYDLVILNPPYGDRPAADRAADPEGAQWSNHTYFVERASRLLRPGGVLVAITPASEILGHDVENKRFREGMLGRCHFAGAVFPPSTIFPYVNPGMNAFAIHAWVRLPDGHRRLTIEEQRVLDGEYLDTASGEHNTIGEWVEAVEGRPSVRGDFDPARVVSASLRPIGIAEMVALKAWRREHPVAAPETRAPVPPPLPEEVVADVRVKTPRVKTPRAKARASEVLTGPVALSKMTDADFGVVEEATAFAYRVQRFGSLVASDPETAESGRAELRADLEEFVQRHGSPHDIPEVRDNPGCAQLLTAIQPDGALAPLLARALATIDVPPEQSDVFGIIEWYSHRYGVCTDRDLLRHASPEDVEAALPDLLVSEDYAIEPRAEESWYYTVTDYLAGDLYAKLDALDAALSGTVEGPLGEKLTAQKILLLQTIQPQTLADITVTPRSGFVPVDCLTAFANRTLAQMASGSNPNVQLVIEQGLLRAVPGTTEGLFDVQMEWLQWLFGYWNRQLSVVDPNEKTAKRSDIFDTADVSMRLKLEKKLEDEFRRWVAIDESWRPIIEDKYNRLFRGHRPRVFGDASLGLARNFGGQFTPKPHQNSAARRITDKRGGILALDVGGGKCQVYANLSLTSWGLIPIGELFGDQAVGPEPELWIPAPAGLMVLSHVKGQPVWQRVKRLYRQRIADTESMVVVTTARGARTEVTRAHPLLSVRDGGTTWTSSGNLFEGDVLAMAKNLPVPPEPCIPPDLGLEDPQRLEDLVVLLTWGIGEGSENDGGNTARIHQDDVSVLERLLVRARRLLPKTDPSMIRIDRPSSRNPRSPYLTICSPEYRKLLRDIGYGWGHLSAAERLPFWFTTLPDHLVRLCLRAYFDGEGSADDRGDIEMTSASRLLVEQVQYMLLRFGIKGSLHPRQGRATNGKMKESKTYWRLTILGEDAERFAREIGTDVGYKREAMEQGFGKKRNPNFGIPVADVMTQLAEVGITTKAMGLDRVGNFVSASRDTVEAIIERATYLGSAEGRAYYEKWQHGTHRAVGTARAIHTSEGQEALRQAIVTLRARLDASYTYDVVVSLEAGQRGGFVYDFEVDTEDYDDKNYVGGAGAFVMHNTISGLSSVANLRQNGQVRRPIIVVPNNILFKWYRDCRKLLPDYRVGIIGYSIKTKTASDVPLELGQKAARGASKDSPAERAAKWRKFSEGAYDLLIVPFSNFLDDVELTDKSVFDILSKVFWLQRKLGVDAEERRLLQRRIEKGRKEVQEANKELDEAKRYDDERSVEQITKKIGDLIEKIAKWEEKLKQPSAAEIEQVRNDLEGITHTKPFRPRAKAPKPWSTGAKKGELLKYLLDVGFGDALNVETGAVNPEVARQFVTGTVADMEAMAHFDWTGPGRVSKERLLQILRTFFPPQTSGTIPKPGLVTWESLGIDFMVVDEAHNFKNVWYPLCRLGVSKISYMGSCGQRIAPKPWDMWLKAQHLLGSRGSDGGVMLLTATPIKNGPIETYNLLSLVSRHVWTQREVRSSEEFIDRYCTLAHEVTVNPSTFSAEMNLGMAGFQNLDELRAIMDLYMERKTIDDLLALGVLDRVPKPLNETVAVAMDQRQLDIYAGVREAIKEEIEAAKEDKDRAASGGMILLQMDMLSKVALDPRLLQKDVAELRQTLAEQSEVAAKYATWLRGGQRGKEPKAPLADETAEFLQKRLDLLLSLGIETIVEDYARSGEILPKYVELAQFIRRNAACGHIVFVDFNATHEYVAEAITAIVGPETLPRSRIAIVTGDLDPDERQQISDDFNGADQEIDEATGAVVSEAREPLYDVIIGNSSVMAEGIDLQRRTCAIHHLNLPWEPATLQQRNGRGVRQGNTLEAVAIRYYIAERSFDGFKFDMVFGKGEWQRTLFSPGVRQMANPAAGSTLSREEALVWLVAENPEEAQGLIEQVKRQKDEYVRARQREEAKSRFSSLVDQYTQARKQADPAARAALFSAADRLAAELRLMPDEAFPNKAVLEVAREFPVFYDFDSGLFFHQGEFVCFGSAGDGEGHVRRHVEVMRVDPTPGGAYFVVRNFGTPQMRGDFAASGLLGRGFDGPVIRIDPALCGEWDVERDEQAILDRSLTIGDTLELGTLYDRLIDRLWPILIERGMTQAGYLANPSDVGLTPLFKTVGDKTEVLLLPYDVIDAIYSREQQETVKGILASWRLIPPRRRDSWALFSNAFQKDNVFILGRAGRGATGSFTILPLDLDDPRRSAEFRKTAQQWFNRPEGMPPGMIRTWRAVRERKERRVKEET